MEATKKTIIHVWHEGVHSFLRFSLLPRRQFRRLMVGLCVLAITVLVVHVYLFYRVQSHTIFATDTTQTTSTPVVNEAKLTRVLEKFENKALIRSTALQLTPVVVEPSK